MNPAVVLIIPFFGLGTAIDTKVFFVWAGGDEGDDDGGDVVVKEGGGPVVEAGGDGDADGIVVGEDGGPVVVAGGGAYLRVINENFTVLQKSCSLGKTIWTNFDEFSENFQTASDPPTLFSENNVTLFSGGPKICNEIHSDWCDPPPLFPKIHCFYRPKVLVFNTKICNIIY